MQLKKGTKINKVYSLLLTHEYMKKSTIIEKTGISKSSLSSILTRLRRLGLAEYTGTFGTDLGWKRHPLDKPLYPPQPDILNSNKKPNLIVNPDVDQNMIISRINTLMNELSHEIQLLRNRCEDSIFVDSGVEIKGVKLYSKKEQNELL